LGDLKTAARMAKSRLVRHPTATREFGVLTRLDECLGDDELIYKPQEIAGKGRYLLGSTGWKRHGFAETDF
jgi:hypothetical protein